MLNDIRPGESATSEHNTLKFDVLHTQIRKLKQIEPDRAIRQEIMVQSTVIKYDCPMCLPEHNIRNSNYFNVRNRKSKKWAKVAFDQAPDG